MRIDTQWRDQTTELINRFGWKLCGVRGDETHFPFIYTLGNCASGLPELLMIGSSNEATLNSICELMRWCRRAFQERELIELPCYDYAFRAVNGNDDAKIYAWQVDAYYRFEDYSVQQILIPDNSGRFPDDPECEEPYRLVPILTGRSKLGKGPAYGLSSRDVPCENRAWPQTQLQNQRRRLSQRALRND